LMACTVSLFLLEWQWEYAFERFGVP